MQAVRCPEASCVRDDHRLSLLVLECRIAGKEELLVLGSYPEVSFARAREPAFRACNAGRSGDVAHGAADR